MRALWSRSGPSKRANLALPMEGIRLNATQYPTSSLLVDIATLA